VSLTSQLDPVANPALTNVRSVIELVPALEKVGFVPEFSSTRSSAAKLSSSDFLLALVRGLPHSVAQALKSPTITAGRFSRASSAISSSADIAWRQVTVIESNIIHMGPSEAISAFFPANLSPWISAAPYCRFFYIICYPLSGICIPVLLMSAMSTSFSMTFCSNND